MKLKNKKTGEIAEFAVHKRIEDSEDGNQVYAPFVIDPEEWEDYEESKESEHYWYIGYKNDIRRTKYHHISDFADNQVTATRKEIGNCFESLEEAEKAVEKLKAWKRLKDKGFRFTLTPVVGSLDVTPDKFQIEINADMPAKWFCCDAVQKDLEVCFGGEE